MPMKLIIILYELRNDMYLCIFSFLNHHYNSKKLYTTTNPQVSIIINTSRYSRLFSNGSLKSTRFNSNAILATGFKLPVKKKSGCPSNFIYLPEATDLRPAANAVFMYLYLKT